MAEDCGCPKPSGMRTEAAKKSDKRVEKEDVPLQCTGRLVLGTDGWKFQADPGEPCIATVNSINETLGPASKRYLFQHIDSSDLNLRDAVNKLRRNSGLERR